MKKKVLSMGLVATALAAMLGLAGCGASLDREVEIQGMALSVPSNWEESADGGNTSEAGRIVYEKMADDSDDPYEAIVVSYERINDDSPADANEALVLIQQRVEEDYLATEWSIDEDDSEIVDGAKVTSFEYSFEKEIDHVSHLYEYRTAYAFTADMIYEISVYGDEVSLADAVGSIEF